MSATERGYTVLRGDTLSGIAAKHGISSWKSIYEAPANVAFRRKRPNPNLIQPGDRIVIPPDALEAAKQRLKNLQEIKKDFEQSHHKQLRQLDADFRDVRKVATTVDTVATVSQMLFNVGGLVQSGYKSLGLSGAELAKANQKLVRTHVSNTTQTTAGIVGSGMNVTGEEGLTWAVTKILLRSWSDMWSPSYWAGRWVGKTPEQAYREAKQHAANTYQAIVRQLDDKITKTRQVVSELERERNLPLPR